MNRVVAVVGMCGSGKSIACEILEEKGWKKLYFGGITYQKMKEAGIERTPDSERIFREKLREKYGRECYAKLLYPEITKELKKGDVVLDGLYSWYEYTYLQEKFPNNLKLICIVCDKDIRYKRISERKERPFNRNKAMQRDLSEIENLYKGGPIAYADYFLFNNGTLKEYNQRLNEIITKIKEEVK